MPMVRTQLNQIPNNNVFPLEKFLERRKLTKEKWLKDNNISSVVSLNDYLVANSLAITTQTTQEELFALLPDQFINNDEQNPQPNEPYITDASLEPISDSFVEKIDFTVSNETTDTVLITTDHSKYKQNTPSKTKKTNSNN